MHSKVFKKVMLAVPLDYLTQDQYVQAEEANVQGSSKREFRGMALRMRAIISMT